MAKAIALEDFQRVFGSLTELSSVALGASIVSCSDEFFAPASDLLKVAPALSMKGQFGPKGALFDGWETRRHCPTYDWAIIRLGAAGTLQGFDIDTANFNGNEGPAASVHGVYMPNGVLTPDDAKWETLLEQTPLGPSSRHLFQLSTTTEPVTHLKLSMYPDGGIARFRAYGHVVPLPPIRGEEHAPLDLAYVMNGGRVVAVSDQHFGVGPNLVLPGRGKDMGDGWETKRSRLPGHNDWAIIKLGAPGFLQWTEIDTIHFVGNFPQSCELFAVASSEDVPSAEADWKPILAQSKLKPHQQHFFQLELLEEPVTHVKLVIHPDGGIKRVRLIGRRALPSSSSSQEPISNPIGWTKSLPPKPVYSREDARRIELSKLPQIPQIPALPLTESAFAPYGHVIETIARSTPTSAEDDTRTMVASTRGGVQVKTVNLGTAQKYNHLAPVKYTHPEVKAELNFCIFRCDRQRSPLANDMWPVEALERHEFSTQSFVPMGGCGKSARYLVIVCLPGQDGQPDFATLRAFVATSSQGIQYHPNVWHHPLIALAETNEIDEDKMEFSCLVYESGLAQVDCELQEYDEAKAMVLL